jgi:hypothetical protein
MRDKIADCAEIVDCWSAESQPGHELLRTSRLVLLLLCLFDGANPLLDIVPDYVFVPAFTAIASVDASLDIGVQLIEKRVAATLEHERIVPPFESILCRYFLAC